MSKEVLVKIASPTPKQWEKYMKLFEDEPDIQRILELLSLNNQLEVKRCMRRFRSTTTRVANTRFRRAGYNVRLQFSAETIDAPFEDRVVHLYTAEIQNPAKAPA